MNKQYYYIRNGTLLVEWNNCVDVSPNTAVFIVKILRSINNGLYY